MSNLYNLFHRGEQNDRQKSHPGNSWPLHIFAMMSALFFIGGWKEVTLVRTAGFQKLNWAVKLMLRGHWAPLVCRNQVLSLHKSLPVDTGPYCYRQGTTWKTQGPIKEPSIASFTIPRIQEDTVNTFILQPSNVPQTKSEDVEKMYEICWFIFSLTEAAFVVAY